jgi:hypothetical protein
VENEILELKFTGLVEEASSWFQEKEASESRRNIAGKARREN